MSTPINREDIRKGDRVRRTTVYEYTVTTEQLRGSTPEGYTYELIERPVVLPDEMGTVIRSNRRSSDNDVGWVFERGGHKWYGTDGETYTPEEVAALMWGKGYQVLRPVAEVAAEVLEDLESEMTARFGWTFFEPSGKTGDSFAAVAAKWAAK